MLIAFRRPQQKKTAVVFGLKKALSHPVSAGADTAFIAVWLPPRARDVFASIPRLEPDLHMTLLYLEGAVNTDADREAILAAVQDWAARTDPLKCELTGSAVFNSPHEPLVGTVKVDHGAEAYADLRETVERHWQAVKTEYDWYPHVTLQNDAAQKRVNVPDFKWTAGRVSVQFERDGYRYEFKLGTGEALRKAVAPVQGYYKPSIGKWVQAHSREARAGNRGDASEPQRAQGPRITMKDSKNASRSAEDLEKRYGKPTADHQAFIGDDLPVMLRQHGNGSKRGYGIYDADGKLMGTVHTQAMQDGSGVAVTSTWTSPHAYGQKAHMPLLRRLVSEYKHVYSPHTLHADFWATVQAMGKDGGDYERAEAGNRYQVKRREQAALFGDDEMAKSARKLVVVFGDAAKWVRLAKGRVKAHYKPSIAKWVPSYRTKRPEAMQQAGQLSMFGGGSQEDTAQPDEQQQLRLFGEAPPQDRVKPDAKYTIDQRIPPGGPKAKDAKRAGVTRQQVVDAMDLFDQYGLRLNRYYSGTPKVGWYVQGIRSSRIGGAMWSMMRVGLREAVENPSAIIKQWREYAKDGAIAEESDEKPLPPSPSTQDTEPAREEGEAGTLADPDEDGPTVGDEFADDDDDGGWKPASMKEHFISAHKAGRMDLFEKLAEAQDGLAQSQQVIDERDQYLQEHSDTKAQLRRELRQEYAKTKDPKVARALLRGKTMPDPREGREFGRIGTDGTRDRARAIAGQTKRDKQAREYSNVDQIADDYQARVDALKEAIAELGLERPRVRTQAEIDAQELADTEVSAGAPAAVHDVFGRRRVNYELSADKLRSGEGRRKEADDYVKRELYEAKAVLNDIVAQYGLGRLEQAVRSQKQHMQKVVRDFNAGQGKRKPIRGKGHPNPTGHRGHYSEDEAMRSLDAEVGVIRELFKRAIAERQAAPAAKSLRRVAVVFRRTA